MISDLAEWLEAQGLGQYARVLAENEVDLEALRLLQSEHDLQELGIPLGPRKKLLKAIETTGSAGTIAPPRSPDSYTPKHLEQHCGDEAWAHQILGEVHASRGLAVLDQACEQFRQGMDLAKELGMRPLIARC